LKVINENDDYLGDNLLIRHKMWNGAWNHQLKEIMFHKYPNKIDKDMICEKLTKVVPQLFVYIKY